MAQQLTMIPATIARTNGTGFTTQEEPGRWFNVSKWADPRPDIPPKGTPVRLQLDAGGFVRSIEPLELAPHPNGSQPRQEAPTAPPARERVITRLACLKAAVTFCASRPEAKCGDVLTVAAGWEAWVNRS
jgi:hypothetical protein